ncbi:xanthine dehydrogenase small subunit [Fodinicurvata sp. EGI_FJ10296]|uniref:xanthine dehydrogenase small subunit n=1 Tax=Fodinicurvata sp. EGI_FJ10296 TaxID=3231908 RepID=UPI003455A9F4
MTQTVRFLLNGAARCVPDVPRTRTMLQHLRLHERLTGTKEGCAEGDCGACTVMVGTPREGHGFDWRAVNGCILLLTEVADRAVVTVEGLGDNDTLHPVQSAMVESHGSQCGYCTPGFIMSMAAHRAAGLPDTDDAIHETLSGNLCRCTGYRPIVDALRTAAPAPLAADREADWSAALATLSADDRLDVPVSVDQLDAMLAANPGLRLLAGGTDLGVAIAKDAADPGAMVPVSRIPELRQTEIDRDIVTIGAAVTYADALPILDEAAPAIAAMVRRIGSRQIRNAGTIGGNLCNASPIGDSAPALLALGATVMLRSARGRREVALEDFFTAYRQTVLTPGEYLEWIRFRRPPADQVYRVYKLSKRYDQDISTISMAASIDRSDGVVTGARLAFGGMAATPSRAPAAEAALTGTALDGRAVEAAAAALSRDFQPLSDFRGSAAYRMAAAAGLLRRLSLEVGADARTDGQTHAAPMEVWQL